MKSEDEIGFTLGDYTADCGAVAHSREEVDDDPLTILDKPDPIFNRKELLNIDHIPDSEKIVGRDRQIQDVARKMKAAQRGESGEGTIITGKSGSGKTLVTNYIIQEVDYRAKKNGVRLGSAVVDCGQTRSEHQTVVAIGEELNKGVESGLTFPTNGVATTVIYNRLWDLINQFYDSVIIAFDEIDRLGPKNSGSENASGRSDDSELLMQLSRAGEEGDVDAGLTIFGISNDLKYSDRLDTRVESSFKPSEIVFPAYDAEQLGNILDRRRDAFHEGVLSDGVIPLCAGLSAQDHGDARRALDLFRLSGVVASEEGMSQVTEDHVRTADEDAEVSRLAGLISGDPNQMKIGLVALAALSEFAEERSHFTATEMYEVYRFFAKSIDLDVRSQRRIRTLMKEYDTMNVINMTKNSGYRKGVFWELTLLDDPAIVLQTVGLDSRLNSIPLGEKVQEQIRDFTN